HAAPQSFGDRDDIGNNIEMLKRKPFTGTGRGGPNFIANQQQAVCITQRAYSLNKSRIRNIDSALTLNRLKKYPACFVIDGIFQGFQVTEGYFDRTRQHRSEAFLEARRAKTQAAHSPAVKTAVKAYYFEFFSVCS